MIVRQIWTANAYRNFNYLFARGESGEALAVDPLITLSWSFRRSESPGCASAGSAPEEARRCLPLQ